MVLFTCSVKTIKCITHKNGDVKGTCKRGVNCAIDYWPLKKNPLPPPLPPSQTKTKQKRTLMKSPNVVKLSDHDSELTIQWR